VNVSDKMLIRPVKHGDFAQWKPLWDGYSAFYGRKDKSALPDEITNLKWSRFFDGYEPLHAQVADCSGQLLGLAAFPASSQHYHAHVKLLLQDLFTQETARGKGVGRALIEEVWVYWQTHETNETAMKLYDKVAEKSGFLIYRKML
jgi:GNAT superfamily N-acetyltransferase